MTRIFVQRLEILEYEIKPQQFVSLKAVVSNFYEIFEELLSE
jgi:hypothetical protein